MPGLWRDLFRGNDFLTQGLPILMLLAVGSLGTGLVFERMVPLLQAYPGLIVLVPPLIGLRGNINASLGSRLGSAVHLGLIEPGTMWDPEVRENVLGSLMLSGLMPALAAVLAWVVSRALGIAVIPLWLLVAVATVAGLVSGLLLAAITVGIVTWSHRHGVDPDNVTGPGLATVGDVLTLLVLFATSALVLGGWT